MDRNRASICTVSVCVALTWALAFINGSACANEPEFMRKVSPASIRVLCYNVNWDAIFPDDDPANHKYRRYNKSAEFVRVLKALRPDVVCIQEVNADRDPAAVARILNAALPLRSGAEWQVYTGRDDVIAAPYPLKKCAADTVPSTGRGHAMALIDLPDDAYRYDLYIINAHTKSAGGAENIHRREKHGDAIVNWIRDLRSAGGAIDLAVHTPIVVLGDLNVYPTDAHRHLHTLVTGDIIDEKTYGPDFKPDWDDSHLSDIVFHHNLTGQDTYTWRNDADRFDPYPLDHVIFTDSVMTAEKAFVLNTATMNESDLAAAGLQAADVALDMTTGDFDHFPLVVDFHVPGHASGDANEDGRVDVDDFLRFLSCYNSPREAGRRLAAPDCVGVFDFDEDADIDIDDFNELQSRFTKP